MTDAAPGVRSLLFRHPEIRCCGVRRVHVRGDPNPARDTRLRDGLRDRDGWLHTSLRGRPVSASAPGLWTCRCSGASPTPAHRTLETADGAPGVRSLLFRHPG